MLAFHNSGGQMIVEMRATPRKAKHGTARDIKSYDMPGEDALGEDTYFAQDFFARLCRLAGGPNKLRLPRYKNGILYIEVSNSVYDILEARFVGAANSSVDHIHKLRSQHKI